jgi:hypothetical protein
MIAFTNLLVRIAVKDDPAQVAIARDLAMRTPYSVSPGGSAHNACQ